MIQIPAQIQTRYEAIVVKKAIPERHHLYYRKWLLYYLDFCHKYDLKQSNKKSLSHFINKLREKNQTDQQQKQASHAVSIYYEIGTTNSGENASFKNKNTIISTEKEGLKSKKTN